MTTLKDLSKALNLSVTQVSRALNGHSDVSEITRNRVEKAAKALNYEPNISARRLVTGRSGLVALVMSYSPDLSQDGQFLNAVGGMSQHFSRAGLQFVLHMADPDEDEVAVYRKLVSGGGIDGFVVLDPRIGDKRLAYLRKNAVPFVLHGRDTARPDYPFFDIDNFRVGYDLTHHLLDRGHRRIAFLNGVQDRTHAAHRADGYRAALAKFAVPYVSALMRNDLMSQGFGIRETIRLLDARGPRPTALIAGNTRIANGIYQGLAALGLRVPHDVSVVAHDDLFPDVHAGAMLPPLTATESPMNLSWEPLARFLTAALSGTQVSDLQILETARFVDRNSVAAPPSDPASIPG